MTANDPKRTWLDADPSDTMTPMEFLSPSGSNALPGGLIAASAKANNRDYYALAWAFGDGIASIAANDRMRMARRQRTLT